MSESNEEFKSEMEEAECQQDFCECSHCQEAEEEYQEDLERGYQRDILSDEVNEYDGSEEMYEAAEYENRQRIREYWEGEEARERYELARQKCLLEEEIDECLRKYIELEGSPSDIKMIRFCILETVAKVKIQFNESNNN